MAWIAPKIDWTDDDKINFADFNRIENNLNEVAAYLNSIQYSIPAMTSVTNRTISSIDFISSINRIEQNLETIRINFVTPPSYIPGKTWTVSKGFDYTDANRLESNLQLLLDYGLLVYKSFRRCGALICGDQGGLY
jgi:hypothetical protein